MATYQSKCVLKQTGDSNSDWKCLFNKIDFLFCNRSIIRFTLEQTDFFFILMLKTQFELKKPKNNINQL